MSVNGACQGVEEGMDDGGEWRYQAGRFRQHRVDLDDLAGDRGVNVAGGLHTLHVAEGLSRRDTCAVVRQLHEHHLTKVALKQSQV
jgi:hypothetical protein